MANDSCWQEVGIREIIGVARLNEQGWPVFCPSRFRGGFAGHCRSCRSGTFEEAADRLSANLPGPEPCL